AYPGACRGVRAPGVRLWTPGAGRGCLEATVSRGGFRVAPPRPHRRLMTGWEALSMALTGETGNVTARTRARQRARDWAEIQERMLVPLYEAVYGRLEVGPATSVLGLGCRSGLALLLAAARGAEVLGTESEEELRALARARQLRVRPAPGADGARRPRGAGDLGAAGALRERERAARRPAARPARGRRPVRAEPAGRAGSPGPGVRAAPGRRRAGGLPLRVPGPGERAARAALDRRVRRRRGVLQRVAGREGARRGALPLRPSGRHRPDAERLPLPAGGGGAVALLSGSATAGRPATPRR